MPKSKLIENIELGFGVALIFAGGIGALYILFHFYLISIVLLNVLPFVALWLWKFYQYEFTEIVLNKIVQYAVGFTLVCAFLILMRSQIVETHIDKFFLNGKIQSKMVTDENDEGNEYTERRYFFFLDDPNDQWKKDVIGWYMWFMILGSPIMTIKLVGAIKNKHEKPRPIS